MHLQDHESPTIQMPKSEVHHLENLTETLDQLKAATAYLGISLIRCQQLTTLDQETVQIELEALSSRFVRVIDLLIHKVYRSIDRVELLPYGSLAETLTRAKNRGLIDSHQQIDGLRDLKNEIQHEYMSHKIPILQNRALNQTKELIELIPKIFDYCRQYHASTD